MVMDGFTASYRALEKWLSGKRECSARQMGRVAEVLELSEGPDDKA